MKKIVCISLLFIMASYTLAADVIITKQNKKYEGKVVKTTTKSLIVELVNGTIIVVPKDDIAEVRRGKYIFDFEKKMRYYMEVHHPFIPLMVLAIASGAYSVKKFGEYKDERERIKNETPDQVEKNTSDRSSEFLALGVVSVLLCAGSFYISLKPMEVKVPIGRIKISAAISGNRVMLSFNF